MYCSLAFFGLIKGSQVRTTLYSIINSTKEKLNRLDTLTHLILPVNFHFTLKLLMYELRTIRYHILLSNRVNQLGIQGQLIGYDTTAHVIRFRLRSML